MHYFKKNQPDDALRNGLFTKGFQNNLLNQLFDQSD